MPHVAERLDVEITLFAHETGKGHILGIRRGEQISLLQEATLLNYYFS